MKKILSFTIISTVLLLIATALYMTIYSYGGIALDESLSYREYFAVVKTREFLLLIVLIVNSFFSIVLSVFLFKKTMLEKN